MSTSAYTPVDLGVTGPYLVARPGTQQGWERIVYEVLGYAWEWRGTVRTLCAVVNYRSPGALEPITLPIPVSDLHVAQACGVSDSTASRGAR